MPRRRIGRMPSAVTIARGRLACLWLSQVARILADNCLRVFIVLEVARASMEWRDAAWHLASALLAAPAIVLAPLNGGLSNSLPKRSVLVGSTTFVVMVLAVFALLGQYWLACWALVAV